MSRREEAGKLDAENIGPLTAGAILVTNPRIDQLFCADAAAELSITSKFRKRMICVCSRSCPGVTSVFFREVREPDGQDSQGNLTIDVSSVLEGTHYPASFGLLEFQRLFSPAKLRA
jgi:hypothetical protein